jgi:hypothetical protein
VVTVLDIEDFSMLFAHKAPATLLGVHGEVATDVEVVRTELVDQRKA